MIDTLTSTAVSITSVGNIHTASFTLSGNYVGNQDHYVIVEQGAFVGVDNNCPGGGPVTRNGVLNKGDWTFTTPPCVNDGDCHSNARCIGAACVCNLGFTGNGLTTCNDIDECTIHIHDCHDFSLCANIIGSFTCTCRPGYTRNGHACVPKYKCLLNTDDCSDNADCSETIESFTCTCRLGFRGNGRNCVDIDECTENTDNCHANAFCTNTLGSFICTCNSGYTGDGISCTDIDECANLSLNNCHSTALCLNLDGSFQCICPTGFTGDPINGPCVGCTDDSHCHPSGICRVVTGIIRDCFCRIGFTGDGNNDCYDINECVDPSTNNCHKRANCINLEGSFRCECTANFSGDGVNSCVGKIIMYSFTVE